MFNWVVCRDADWRTSCPSQSLTMQTVLSFNMLCLTTIITSHGLIVSILVIIISIICLWVPIDSLGWGHWTNWSLTRIIDKRAIHINLFRNLFTIDRDYRISVATSQSVINASWSALRLTPRYISDQSIIIVVLRLLYLSTLIIVVIILRIFLLLILNGELAKRR